MDRGDVTIHAEDGVGYNKTTSVRMPMLSKELLQGIHVRMGIDMDCRSRQAASIDQARVVEFIAEDHILSGR